MGSNLVAYLASVNEIYGLDIVAPEKDGVVKTFSWEDLDAGRVPEVDAIIHLAGKAHDTKDQAAAEVYFKVNTGLTKDVPTGIYNMGDDEALSTNELIEEICASLGKKAHIWRLPKGMMTGMARVGGWLHLPLNPERLRKLTEN